MRNATPHPLIMASPTASQYHRVGQGAGGFNLLSLQNLGRAEEGDGARENGELDAAENLLDVKKIHVSQVHFWGLGSGLGPEQTPSINIVDNNNNNSIRYLCLYLLFH